MAINNALYRLAYISEYVVTDDHATVRQEIVRILEAARQRNIQAGISGAMMFNDDRFAQVLEGEHDVIQRTFERIQCNPRHANVTILSFEAVPKRAFSAWTLAYVGTDADRITEFSDIKKNSGLDPKSSSAKRIFDLLQEHLQDSEK